MDSVSPRCRTAVGMVYQDHKVEGRFRTEREGEPGVDVKILYEREKAEER